MSGSTTSKAWSECSHGELVHAAEGHEFLLGRIAVLGSDLIDDWDALSDDERFRRIQRVLGVSLVSLRPLNDDALKLLRQYVDERLDADPSDIPPESDE